MENDNITREKKLEFVDVILDIVKNACIESIEKGGDIRFNNSKIGMDWQWSNEKPVMVDNGSRRIVIEISNPYELPKY